MLSRRSFFAAAAGAVAGAAGVAAAKPATISGVDLAAPAADRGVLVMSGPLNYDFDWANDAVVSPARFNDAVRASMRGTRNPIYRLEEFYFEPNDLTREQLAANLPVIGADPLPKATPAERARHQRLLKECNRPVPDKETEKQFLRRMSLPCPGRLE